MYVNCVYVTNDVSGNVNGEILNLINNGTAITAFPYSRLTESLIMKLTYTGTVYHYLPVTDNGGGGNADTISTFTVDSSDRVYAAGYSTTGANSIITRAFSANYYAPSRTLNQDANTLQGEQAWIVVWDGTGAIYSNAKLINVANNEPISLVHDDVNNALFVGMTDSSSNFTINVTNFNSATYTRTVDNAYVIKLFDLGYGTASNENVVSMDGNAINEIPMSLDLDSSQNLYVSVYARQTLKVSKPNFSTTATGLDAPILTASALNATNYMVCLVKMDNSLNPVWVAAIDTGTWSTPQSVVKTLANNNVFVLLTSTATTVLYKTTNASGDVETPNISFVMTDTTKYAALVRYNSSGNLYQDDYLFFNSSTSTTTTVVMSVRNDELYVDLFYYGVFTCTNKAGTVLLTVGSTASTSFGNVFLKVTNTFQVSLVSYTDTGTSLLYSFDENATSRKIRNSSGALIATVTEATSGTAVLQGNDLVWYVRGDTTPLKNTAHTVDAEGNVYISYSYTATGTSKLTTATNNTISTTAAYGGTLTDVIIMKYSSAGAFEYQFVVRSTLSEDVIGFQCLTADASNNLYASGFSSTAALTFFNSSNVGTTSTITPSTGTNGWIAKWTSAGELDSYAILQTVSADQIYCSKVNPTNQIFYAALSTVGSGTLTGKDFTAAAISRSISANANAVIIRMQAKTVSQPNNHSITCLGQLNNDNGSGSVETISSIDIDISGNVYVSANFTLFGTNAGVNMQLFGRSVTTAAPTTIFNRTAANRKHMMCVIKYSAILALSWVGIFETNYTPYSTNTPSDEQVLGYGRNPSSLCCVNSIGVYHLCTADSQTSAAAIGGVIIGSLGPTGAVLDAENRTVGTSAGTDPFTSFCLIMYDLNGTYLRNTVYSANSSTTSIRHLYTANDEVYVCFQYNNVLTYNGPSGATTHGSSGSSGTALFRLSVVSSVLVSTLLSYTDIV